MTGLRSELEYQIQYRAVGAVNWTNLPLQNTRYAVLSNLEPGTVYEFQTRAHDARGYSNWSDIVTAIAD